MSKSKAKMIRNLKDLCAHFDADKPASLNRRIYKNTECGASISVQTLDDVWHHNGKDWSQIRKIKAFTIQTIVEGSDAEINSDPFVLPVQASLVDNWIKDMESDAAKIWQEDNADLHECQNCDWKGQQSDLNTIEDIHQRVAPGEPMPSGACPECGALCHPVKNIKARLEYLRQELREERISYGELAELQSLIEHIDLNDTELLEAAGVPEPMAKIKQLTEEIRSHCGNYGWMEENLLDRLAQITKLATLVVLVFAMLLVLPTVLSAQQLPEAPKPKFFDTQTRLEVAASAATIAMDGLSTMKFMAYHRAPYNLKEPNPIARPFVNSRPLASVYFAGGFAGELMLMKWADRRGMRRTKHIIPIVTAVGEGVLTWSNYRYAHRASERNNCIIHNPVNSGGVSSCAFLGN